MTIRQAIQFGIKRISKISQQNDFQSGFEFSDFIPSPSAALDVNCFLEHILQQNRTFLLVHYDQELSEEQQEMFEQMLQKRRTGLPVAYITGKKEFYGLNFYVTPDVLIPKPDTELLVEHAVLAARKILESATADEKIKIADVCTGSGCIAISVLHALLEDTELSTGSTANLQFFASDISKEALKIAELNAANLLPPQKKITFFNGDLLSAFPTKTKFNLILSNPPYIPAAEVTELLKDGRNEPRLALDGDVGATSDGTAIIRRLIVQVKEKLVSGGLFLIETGEYNAEKTAAILEESGFIDVKIFKDLSGQLRLTQAVKS